MQVIGDAIQTTRKAAWKLLGARRGQPVRTGLAFALGHRRFGRLLLGPRLDAVRTAILGAFLTSGSPPSIESLASVLRRPESELGDDLDELVHRGIIRLGNANIVATAFPFSLTPTPHRVRFAKSREVYALSALDALGIALLAGGTGEVLSSCPRTGEAVCIGLRQGSIAARTPEKCVLVMTGETKQTAEAPHRGDFFASRTDALEWLNMQQPLNGHVLPLSIAFLVAKLFFDDRLTLVS